MVSLFFSTLLWTFSIWIFTNETCTYQVEDLTSSAMNFQDFSSPRPLLQLWIQTFQTRSQHAWTLNHNQTMKTLPLWTPTKKFLLQTFLCFNLLYLAVEHDSGIFRDSVSLMDVQYVCLQVPGLRFCFFQLFSEQTWFTWHEASTQRWITWAQHVFVVATRWIRRIHGEAFGWKPRGGTRQKLKAPSRRTWAERSSSVFCASCRPA